MLEGMSNLQEDIAGTLLEPCVPSTLIKKGVRVARLAGALPPPPADGRRGRGLRGPGQAWARRTVPAPIWVGGAQHGAAIR